MKNISTLICIALIVFVSCQKDEYIPFPSDIIRVNISVIGKIETEQGIPISDVNVLLDNQMTSSNQEGIFYFKDIMVDVNASVRLEKQGYFRTTKRFYPKSNSVSQLNVMMLENTKKGEFQSASGGNIAIDNESVITFPSNAIETGSGIPYQGTVHLAVKSLPVDDPNLILKMPGDLVGRSLEGNEVVLGTFGMIGVEMRTPSGESLQLAEGQEVIIEWILPQDHVTKAPSTIPLWHFDDDLGLWIEEGEATLVNDRYIGSVSHFSFWNCDAPFELIQAEGCLIHADGTPASDMFVQIESTGLNTISGGITDENGVFRGKLPKNEPLQIIIKQNGPCNQEVVYQQSVGPFSKDIKISSIKLDPPPTFEYSAVTASALNCDGNPLANGIVRLIAGNEKILKPLDENGLTSFNFYNCQNQSVSMKIFDIQNGYESETVELSASPVLKFGESRVCKDLEAFVNININANVIRFVDSGISNSNGEFILNGTGLDSTQVNFILSEIEVKQYELDGRGHSCFLDQGIGQTSYFESPFKLTITDDGNQSGMVKGRFEGIYIEEEWQGQTIVNSMSFPMTGEFLLFR